MSTDAIEATDVIGIEVDFTVIHNERYHHAVSAIDRASFGRAGEEVAPLFPIAPPAILGLFGFAGATFMVAARMAGWYGSAESPSFLFPFAAMFGGLAQFLAGMCGPIAPVTVSARQCMACGAHSDLPTASSTSFVLAAITWMGMAAATAALTTDRFVSARSGHQLRTGAATTAQGDLANADCIMIVGSNIVPKASRMNNVFSIHV